MNPVFNSDFTTITIAMYSFVSCTADDDTADPKHRNVCNYSTHALSFVLKLSGSRCGFTPTE